MLTISQRLTRYFWLSWKWGVLVNALFILSIALFGLINDSPRGLPALLRDNSAAVIFFILLNSGGALLGNLLRQRLMGWLLHRAEEATTIAARFTWLAGGTFLLFVVSVLLCMAAYMVFTFSPGIVSLLGPLLRGFFLLSAPWLLTAPIAACWVCRDWLSAIPNLGATGSKQGNDSH